MNQNHVLHFILKFVEALCEFSFFFGSDLIIIVFMIYIMSFIEIMGLSNEAFKVTTIRQFL